MASFPDAVVAESSGEEGLDPLFLRRQSLNEDLQRWAALESKVRLEERATIANAGLTLRQASVLQLVALAGGRMSVKALLSRLRISKQTLSNNLVGLIREGYARKDGQDARDRRVCVLALNKKGLSFTEDLLEHRARLLRHAYRSAGATQVEGFRRTLLLLSDEDGI